MNRFNGRSAVEEYISTHPLSFSTPDLILKNFVIWLCEPVDDPNGNDEEKIPRVILYTEGGQNRILLDLLTPLKVKKTNYKTLYSGRVIPV